MAFDYSSSFAGINNALANMGKQNELAYQRQTLANLGKQIQSGDYAGAAQAAFAAGDAGTGIGLLKLGQTQKQESDWLKANAGLFGGVAPTGGGAAAPVALGAPNDIENRFVNTVKGAGLTNPVGLAAVAAYGKAESGFSPQNVNRSWSDPSQSGQPGTAGGIMSWRADRLQNLQNFARARGEAQPSVETQALFLAQEDPTLIPKLQAAQSPQEANQIMANAWRFAGYDQPGGENARRLALTQNYAARFGGQPGVAPPAVPVQVAENEADVQRLEAQQGNPVITPPQAAAPVQVAQAGPQPGAPVADVPAKGAAETQFVIPGTDTTAPQSIANDPRVLGLQRALAGAPEKYKASIQARLSAVIDDLKAQRQQSAPTDVARNYALARSQGYQGSFLDYQKELRSQTNVNVKNEGTIPTGFRAVRDPQGNVERLEPIPGSKAEQEAKVAAEKQQKAERIRAEVGNTVGNALDDIDRLMTSATLPTSGAMGARVASIPGTAAYDISQALTTIGANISFQQLQQMREASPTGGALGAVSDAEQKMLQNSYAALSQSQSPEQFKTNLGRVRAVFERIVHGRTLTPQERKTGGPMTIERAKGLRDQAAQAIAGGAPRDAVLKRLKDDYGISTDGL